MDQKRRKRPLMTPAEREQHERRLAETDPLLQEQIAYYRRLPAEQRERWERWEQGILGRFARRVGLARIE